MEVTVLCSYFLRTHERAAIFVFRYLISPGLPRPDGITINFGMFLWQVEREMLAPVWAFCTFNNMERNTSAPPCTIHHQFDTYFYTNNLHALQPVFYINTRGDLMIKPTIHIIVSYRSQPDTPSKQSLKAKALPCFCSLASGIYQHTTD